MGLLSRLRERKPQPGVGHFWECFEDGVTVCRKCSLTREDPQAELACEVDGSGARMVSSRGADDTPSRHEAPPTSPS